MAKKQRRSKIPGTYASASTPAMERPWQPMERGEINPHLLERLRQLGGETGERMEAWSNDIYQAIVRFLPTRRESTGEEAGDLVWLSIKRHDREPIWDWRHLQQIKNEICGPEREAVQIFPAESRLVDTSNEYALFVLPEGERVPFGWTERSVLTPEQIEEFNERERRIDPSAGKARQRPWQEGLTTGDG